MTQPLDHPHPGRPHRVYLALTNHCNRACPWCSTYSSPARRTFLPLEALDAVIPDEGGFELQLEGGEPTVHPDFWDFVAAARAHPRCERLIVCTNGVRIPRRPAALDAWWTRLGRPVTVKMSVNHHLLQRDRGLLELAVALTERSEPDALVVINVRCRPGRDAWVVAAVQHAGLMPHANVFDLQRYGLASDETDWEPPFLVGHDFTLVNPDGQTFGPDLIARSEAMGELP
ncbi:MAG: radical SAM protein [Myxococcales bacterium]|nr:radical SAM protein [Myxococcales bacterium]